MNITKSEEFYFYIKEKKLYADICWKTGTQHSTYYHCIGRVKGELRFNDYFFCENVEYAGGRVFERWMGDIINDGFTCFKLNNFAMYWWYGDYQKNRISSGKLGFTGERYFPK